MNCAGVPIVSLSLWVGLVFLDSFQASCTVEGYQRIPRRGASRRIPARSMITSSVPEAIPLSHLK